MDRRLGSFAGGKECNTTKRAERAKRKRARPTSGVDSHCAGNGRAMMIWMVMIHDVSDEFWKSGQHGQLQFDLN